MVDTTDSKSVASNRVRVQVSSPIIWRPLKEDAFFILQRLLYGRD